MTEKSESIPSSLRLSLIDAFLQSLMVGIGETYLPAFALSIGLGEVFAGVVSTLPLLSGAVLQLLSPRGLQKMGSHKSWVVLWVTLQACAFLPLIYFSFGHSLHFWSLFLILTLYWGAGFAASPAWNYWMGRLVDQKGGQAYFSLRAMLSQTGILVGLVLGGVALHNKVTLPSFTSVFGSLFAVAFLCRMGSSLILSRKLFRQEWTSPTERMMSIRETWRIFWGTPIKRGFFLLQFCYMAAVYVSAPFVTPYFLAQLKLDYGAYMIAIAALMVGKIVALRFLQHRQEAGRTSSGLQIFMAGIVWVAPGPILWAVSSHYAFVLGLQFASGMAWAFLEVGLSLIFFKDLSADEKIPVLTTYNLLNSAAMILGTFVGGILLSFWGENVRGYLLIFALSGFLRIFISRFLVRQCRRWQTSG